MDNKNFSSAVKEVMRLTGINQTEIANRSDYSIAYISNLLNGNKRWNEESIARVSSALGIEISYEVKEAKSDEPRCIDQGNGENRG